MLRISSGFGLAAWFAVASFGCLEITQKEANQSTAATSPDGGADGGITGAGCAIVGTSQLCRATTYCPQLAIDSSQFPNCAFRIRGSVIDIQCVCNGEMLCPMGTPSTCNEAAAMLSSQSELEVCVQVSEGRCTPIGAAAVSGTKSPSCDMFCLSSCDGGDSVCRKTCGC